VISVKICFVIQTSSSNNNSSSTVIVVAAAATCRQFVECRWFCCCSDWCCGAADTTDRANEGLSDCITGSHWLLYQGAEARQSSGSCWSHLTLVVFYAACLCHCCNIMSLHVISVMCITFRDWYFKLPSKTRFYM